MQTLKVATLQLQAFHKKKKALENAKKVIDNLMKQFSMNKPELIILPECFNMLYTGNNFRTHSEDFQDPNSETIKFLSEQASKYNVQILTSIGEYDKNDKEYYNSAIVVNEQGQIASKYRKLHLFEIKMKGQFQMNEKDWLKGGNLGLVTHEIKKGLKIGLGICYDLRFYQQPELIVQEDPSVKLFVYPGSFNMYTGPLHWKLLLQIRALDAQSFLVGCSQATFKINKSVNKVQQQYKMYYGHSSIISPHGQIINQLGEMPGMMVYEFNFDQVDQARQQIPILKQKRSDIYHLEKVY